MAKQFTSYAKEQSEILAEMLRNSAPIENIITELIIMPKRLVLVGSGSSFNAANAAVPVMRSLWEVEIDVVTPTTLLSMGRTVDALYLLVSQSGTSTNMLSALRFLNENHRTSILVTANKESPLAKESANVGIVSCGPENIGPKSKGVTATILFLIQLSVLSAKKFGTCPEVKLTQFRNKLTSIPSHVEATLESGWRFYSQYENQLMKLTNFFIVTDNTMLGVGQESALKVLETCWLPVFAYEMEEFMHGIHYAVGPGTTIFYLLSHNEINRSRMMQMSSFAKSHGAQCFNISAFAENEDIFYLGETNEITQIFAFVVFFQAICAKLSEAKGIDCDVPRYADFSSVMKTKILGRGV